MQNGQKQLKALPLWFFKFALRHEGPRKPGGDETEWTTTSGLRNLCSFFGWA